MGYEGEVERGEVVPFAGLAPPVGFVPFETPVYVAPDPEPGEWVDLGSIGPAEVCREYLGPEPGDADWPWSLPEEADPRVVAVWDLCGGWRPPGSVREVGERLLEQRAGPRLLRPATWGAWLSGEVVP